MVPESTTPARVELEVSTWLACPVTWTCSLTAPMPRERFTAMSAPTVTTMPSRTSVLKLGAVTRTSYGPAGTLEIR